MKYIDNVTIELFKIVLLKYKKILSNQDIFNLLESEQGNNIRTVLQHIVEKYDKNEAKIKSSLEFDKFDKLFAKTRINDFPDLKLFEVIPIELAEKFKIKVYNLFKDSHIFRDPIDLINMIGVFGLFEKDPKVKQRIDMAIKTFIYQDTFSEREIFSNNSFTCDAVQVGYNINEKLIDFIPDVIKPYLYPNLTEQYYLFLKRMKGNIGRKVTDFLTPYIKDKLVYKLKSGSTYYAKLLGLDNIQNIQTLSAAEYENPDANSSLYALINSYERIEKRGYRIKPGLTLEEQKEALKQFKVWELVYSRDDIHGMFSNIKPEYNEEFYNFFINHQSDISAISNNFSKLPDVQVNYLQAKSYYYARGNADPDYITIIEYLREIPYDVEFGDQEFAAESKNAGVLKEAYKYYANLLKQLKKRHVTAVPRHYGIYDFVDKNGKQYKVETKILRTSDPFNMLVGESKYINCCQKYNDEGQICMEHASTSKLGGILVINLIDDTGPKMLTQSWIWVNEQECVIDNIEEATVLSIAPNKLRMTYEDIVAFALKKTAEDILENSNEELKRFAKKRVECIENINDPEIKKQEYARLSEIIKRQSLKVVTIGADYSDIIVGDYFSDKATRSLYLPKDYDKNGYTDAKNRYIAAGSEVNIIHPSDLFDEEPVYRDLRLSELEYGRTVKYSTLKKIIDIENYNHKDKNKFSSLEEFGQIYNLENIKVIHGEDWYCIYEKNGQELIIKRLAKGVPRIADEYDNQLAEMVNVFRYIIGESVIIGEAGNIKKLMVRADSTEGDLYEIYSMLLEQQEIYPLKIDVQSNLDDFSEGLQHRFVFTSAISNATTKAENMMFGKDKKCKNLILSIKGQYPKEAQC